MSLIHEAPVFQIVYDSLKEVHLARRSFSKSEKYMLGEMIEQAGLKALTVIIEAGQTKREWKIPAIDRAQLSLEQMKVGIRLAHDLQELPERRYLILLEMLDKAGRMLGGWRKSI
ncbi:four helix bundle protein [Patescibacteria group bacterium]|nr:MAG: four helix bundle protein [Patescibacteria group bacterium]